MSRPSDTNGAVDTSNLDTTCWICLQTAHESGSAPIKQGCACRGASTLYCHPGCFAEYAAQQFHDRLDSFVFSICPMCKQFICESFCLEVAKLHYDKVKDADTNDWMEFKKLQTSLSQMAISYINLKQLETALSFAQRKCDLESAKKLSLPLEMHSDWVSDDDIAVSCTLLGNCLFGMHHVDDAMTAFKEGLDIVSSVNKCTLANAYLLFGIGEIHAKRAEYTEAIESYQQALAFLEENMGKDQQYYIERSTGLVRLLRKSGEINMAKELAKETRQLGLRLLGPNDLCVKYCNDFLLEVGLRGKSTNDQTVPDYTSLERENHE